MPFVNAKRYEEYEAKQDRFNAGPDTDEVSWCDYCEEIVPSLGDLIEVTYTEVDWTEKTLLVCSCCHDRKPWE